MSKKRPSIYLLLGIILLFSGSVRIMLGRKNGQTASETASQNAANEITMSLQDTLNYLQPLIYTRSIDTIARTLKQFDDKKELAVLQAMLDDKGSPLTKEEKVALLFGSASYHATNKLTQYKIFDLLVKNKQAFGSIAVLLIAAKSDYAPVLADLVTWVKGVNKPQLRRVLQLWTNQALDQVVTDNDITTLEILYVQGIRANKAKAPTLLWKVVAQNKNVAFVPFLIRRSGALVNYVGASKRTLLVKAVENRNKSMVQALLEEGAELNKITDPAIGTALQNALALGYVEIEQLLRSYEK